MPKIRITNQLVNVTLLSSTGGEQRSKLANCMSHHKKIIFRATPNNLQNYRPDVQWKQNCLVLVIYCVERTTTTWIIGQVIVRPSEDVSGRCCSWPKWKKVEWKGASFMCHVQLMLSVLGSAVHVAIVVVHSFPRRRDKFDVHYRQPKKKKVQNTKINLIKFGSQNADK